MSQCRIEFERLCYDYYLRIKAGGWSAPEEGDKSCESLFWRDENNAERYGIHQIEAAWQGFQMAWGHLSPTVLSFHTCLQQATSAVGLLHDVVAAYDAYRGRGVIPAPGEYAQVVAAIEAARRGLGA